MILKKSNELKTNFLCSIYKPLCFKQTNLTVLLYFDKCNCENVCICLLLNFLAIHISLQPTNSSQKVGYMYEFDCKPVLNVSGINTTKWLAIAFEHKVTYIT